MTLQPLPGSVQQALHLGLGEAVVLRDVPDRVQVVVPLHKDGSGLRGQGGKEALDGLGQQAQVHLFLGRVA